MEAPPPPASPPFATATAATPCAAAATRQGRDDVDSGVVFSTDSSDAPCGSSRTDGDAGGDSSDGLPGVGGEEADSTYHTPQEPATTPLLGPTAMDEVVVTTSSTPSRKRKSFSSTIELAGLTLSPTKTLLAATDADGDLRALKGKKPMGKRALENLLQDQDSELGKINLKRVLNYSTLRLLSEEEKNSLLPLLPKEDTLGKSADAVMENLFKENPHFSNALLDYSSHMAAGMFDPEVISQRKIQQASARRRVLDQWKDENFEETWGEKRRKRTEVSRTPKPKATVPSRGLLKIERLALANKIRPPHNTTHDPEHSSGNKKKTDEGDSTPARIKPPKAPLGVPKTTMLVRKTFGNVAGKVGRQTPISAKTPRPTSLNKIGKITRDPPAQHLPNDVVSVPTSTSRRRTSNIPTPREKEIMRRSATRLRMEVFRETDYTRHSLRVDYETWLMQVNSDGTLPLPAVDSLEKSALIHAGTHGPAVKKIPPTAMQRRQPRLSVPKSARLAARALAAAAAEASSITVAPIYEPIEGQTNIDTSVTASALTNSTLPGPLATTPTAVASPGSDQGTIAVQDCLLDPQPPSESVPSTEATAPDTAPTRSSPSSPILVKPTLVVSVGASGDCELPPPVACGSPFSEAQLLPMLMSVCESQQTACPDTPSDAPVTLSSHGTTAINENSPTVCVLKDSSPDIPDAHPPISPPAPVTTAVATSLTPVSSARTATTTAHSLLDDNGEQRFEPHTATAASRALFLQRPTVQETSLIPGPVWLGGAANTSLATESTLVDQEFGFMALPTGVMHLSHHPYHPINMDTFNYFGSPGLMPVIPPPPSIHLPPLPPLPAPRRPTKEQREPLPLASSNLVPYAVPLPPSLPENPTLSVALSTNGSRDSPRATGSSGTSAARPNHHHHYYQHHHHFHHHLLHHKLKAPLPPPPPPPPQSWHTSSRRPTPTKSVMLDPRMDDDAEDTMAVNPDETAPFHQIEVQFEESTVSFDAVGASKQRVISSVHQSGVKTQSDDSSSDSTSPVLGPPPSL